ncbi:GDSL-type esterase/lipase family protein [Spirillospora sp. NPDC127200]
MRRSISLPLSAVLGAAALCAGAATAAQADTLEYVALGDSAAAGPLIPDQPTWPRDADYMQGLVNRLNEHLRKQARAHGAAYVDLAAASVGHDTCAAPDQRYIEGMAPASPAAPLHPNAAGMAAFGAAVARAAR